MSDLSKVLAWLEIPAGEAERGVLSALSRKVDPFSVRRED